MGKTEKPPKKKTAQRENEPALKGDRADSRTTETSDTTRSPDSSSGKPSEEEVISNIAHPVTNQDEQDKITNTDGSDIPVPDK